MDRSVVSTRSRSPRRRVLSPNPQQLQAIRELNPAQTFPGNQQILEWLNITRSVFDPHHFTIKQLKALVTLLRSNDEDIRSWLRIDPYSGEVPISVCP